jgi:hypothetical protein
VCLDGASAMAQAPGSDTISPFCLTQRGGGVLCGSRDSLIGHMTQAYCVLQVPPISSGTTSSKTGSPRNGLMNTRIYWPAKLSQMCREIPVQVTFYYRIRLPRETSLTAICWHSALIQSALVPQRIAVEPDRSHASRKRARARGVPTDNGGCGISAAMPQVASSRSVMFELGPTRNIRRSALLWIHGGVAQNRLGAGRSARGDGAMVRESQDADRRGRPAAGAKWSAGSRRAGRRSG